MKTNGQLLAAILIMVTVGLATQAQDKKQMPKEKSKREKPMPKEHVCTQACHDSGKHVYAHGEKGHVCTDACKK